MATDAFSQGKLAHEHNHPMSSCDYPVGSSLRAEWMAGWTEAGNARPSAPPTIMNDNRESGGRVTHRL